MKLLRFSLFAALFGSSAFAQTNASSPLTVHSAGVVNPYILLKSDAAGNPYGFLQYDQSEGDFMRLFDGSQYSMVWRAGNVGIGTASPSDRLHVNDVLRISPFSSGQGGNYLEASATLKLLNGNIYNNGSGGAVSRIVFGGMYNPSGNQALDFAYNYIEWNSGWLLLKNNQQTKIQIGAGDEWSRQDIYMNPTGGNVGIGTTSPMHKLAVNGTIKAKEVIVETTGWSDYVFADDYQLAPLSEVEAHIKEHKHLPGVPSATQVAEQGANLGEVQAVLLAKVEELTLHLIAQQKQLVAQHEALQGLQRENATLQGRLQKLEGR
jgi:hypothetical protein